jgi:acyl-CoA thioester hydrolase
MITEHEIEIRVRYKETDGQGRVHHGNYFTYFEMGRVEQLRASGYDYRKLEEQGIMLVVQKITCQYMLPAFYDDILVLQTKTVRVTPARIEHEYRITREGDVLVKGHSTLACVDRTGKVRRMPEWIEMDEAKH